MRNPEVLGTFCIGLAVWCSEDRTQTETVTTKHGRDYQLNGDSGMSHIAYCQSYCDSKNVLRPAKTCYSFNEQPIYCCGWRNYRYCCSNRLKQVSPIFGPVRSCPNYNWWYYQWRTIVGLLTSLLLLIVLSACCYQCCGRKTAAVARNFSRRWGQRPGGDTPGSDIPISTVSPNRINRPPDIGDFNPASPNAFQPPPYESLPKDPPKYSDIFGTGQAQENSAFTNDTGGQENGGVLQASGSNTTEINDRSTGGAIRTGQSGNQPERTTTAVNSTPNINSVQLPATNCMTSTAVYENAQLNVPIA
ncbi:hypothetical protein LSAT2_029868 [Lamellibrachia satsuma]|nr:hypothetical protein LSAT2_029868 [Lamellibrachia satsuma]